MTAQTATYAYCVIQSASAVSAARVPAGVPGAKRPRPLPLAGRLWLIAADVPLAIYGMHALDANVRDMEWVSQVAAGHESVVEHFTRMRGATVVPMKFLTLFSSEEKAAKELRRRRPQIEAAVRRIAGCEEWGVRVFAGRSSTSAPERPTAAGASMTGTAFLAARKAAREADGEARARAIEAAGDAFDALAAVARVAKQHPPGAAPGTSPPLLEAAFLVAKPSRASFKTAARRQAALCAAAGAQMTLTGPWPAYNFIGNSGDAA